MTRCPTRAPTFSCIDAATLGLPWQGIRCSSWATRTWRSWWTGLPPGVRSACLWLASLCRLPAQDRTGKGSWRKGGAFYRASVNAVYGPLCACRLPSPGPHWSWLGCWLGWRCGTRRRISNFKPRVTPSYRKRPVISSASRTLTKILTNSTPSLWSSNRSASNAASALSTLWQPVCGPTRSMSVGWSTRSIPPVWKGKNSSCCRRRICAPCGSVSRTPRICSPTWLQRRAYSSC